MRAWRAGAYAPGGDVAAALKAGTAVSLERLPVPAPAAGEVRVRVSYAAVNPIDWKLLTGGLHAAAPVSFPATLGFDLSGVVDAVGAGVDDPELGVGAEVIGNTGLAETCKLPPPAAGSCGAMAEYAVLPASCVAPLAGAGVGLKEAAGLPLVGLTAYQALRTGSGGVSMVDGGPLGDLRAGDKLLVLGGASATGACALQIARALNDAAGDAGEKAGTIATTASSSLMPDGKTTKIDHVKSLGATKVIDYRTQKWADELEGEGFDLIYDVVGDAADLAAAPRVLRKGGLFVSTANFDPASKSTEDVRFANFFYAANGADLRELVRLAGAGALSVGVEKVYAVDELPAAIERSMSGKASGKLLLKFEE